MAYVSNFKKFIKSEDEKKGANPIKEQDAPATPATPATPETPDTAAEPTPTGATQAQIDAVSAARTAVSQAEQNRDKVVAAKQAELDKLKADQDILVNTAKKNLADKLNAAKVTVA